jgi:hypothetical protein
MPGKPIVARMAPRLDARKIDRLASTSLNLPENDSKLREKHFQIKIKAN